MSLKWKKSEKKLHPLWTKSTKLLGNYCTRGLPRIISISWMIVFESLNKKGSEADAVLKKRMYTCLYQCQKFVFPTLIWIMKT